VLVEKRDSVVVVKMLMGAVVIVGLYSGSPTN
jgi:hypothetical protein